MKKNFLSIIILLITVLVNGQETNKNIIVKKDAPIIKINNTSTAQWSNARLDFQNTESKYAPVFSWHLEKTAAGAATGDNSFYLREYDGSDWVNYIAFNESSHNIVVFPNKSSEASYGNLIIKHGNVGIGTSSPSAKLHVAGNTYLGIGEGLELFGDNNYYGTNSDARIFRILDQNGTGGIADGGLTFESYTETDKVAKNILTLRGSGNVGIGCTAPDAKLVVNGTIKATEIKVVDGSALPCSDYVFENGYNLRSLSEVESFVKENKHLPEVPSAKEFKENGYSVGEMDDILLRKIEELTLYVIELKKENEAQQKEIEQLKKQ